MIPCSRHTMGLILQLNLLERTWITLNNPLADYVPAIMFVYVSALGTETFYYEKKCLLLLPVTHLIFIYHQLYSNWSDRPPKNHLFQPFNTRPYLRDCKLEIYNLPRRHWPRVVGQVKKGSQNFQNYYHYMSTLDTCIIFAFHD